MNLSDFKKAIDEYINTYGDKEIFSVINHNTDKHYTICFLDHHRVVGFGGARGGGKSWVFRAKAKLLALKHSGITIVIVRKTYPELTQNHIEPLCNELNVYSKERIARYSDKDKTLRFDNGSRIIFRYCDTEDENKSITVKIEGNAEDYAN